MEGTVVGAVVGKVMDLLFGAAKKELGYMWNCSENVKTFKAESEKLKTMRNTLQDRINDAKNNAQKPGEDLVNWMEKANDKISEAERFCEEEANSKKTCCNLYHYGKMATKESSSLMKHYQDGERFRDCVFDPLPLPQKTDLYERKNLENIDSQKSTLEKIIRAIEDDNKQIVGITGFGGVGKTTLASEVAVELKNKFDYIEFITVSHAVINEVISKDVEVAAKRIKNGDKVLIILDDVWRELKLNEVGIPCLSHYKKSKILLTSRKQDVCVDMKADEIISLDPLPEEEAWTLFERVVGISEWDHILKKVASEIVKECQGLPLLLQAVGMALKGKEILTWETALHQLQTPIDGEATCNGNGLRQLKLSYDYLENDVAKSCFLLCSMFPEDCSIGLRRLTYYALALEILNNPHSIQDAKFKVLWAIDTLKSSSLLQPVVRFNFYRVSQEGEEEEFKMHDLVRDMASFITSKDDNKFLVQYGKGLKEWQPRNDNVKMCKKISLMRTKIRKLPDYTLHLPHLDTLLVLDNYELSNVPDEFFRGMEQLKVLDMSSNNISSLPESLKLLKNLRTLYLSENSSLSDISILGELTLLEILMLRATGISNIPKEIGKLTNLRVLDVDYRNPICVTPGVISKLIWLEEFYIGIEEGDCTFVGELCKLKSLKTLHLKVPDLHYFPEDFHFENLIEFHIKDNIVWLSRTHGCKRILEISQPSFPLTTPIKKLIQVSEMLNVWHIDNLDNYFLQVVYPAGFEKLRYIDLLECENVRSLVKTSDLDELVQRKLNVKFFSQVEEISLRHLASLQLLLDGPHKYISFANLMKIYVTACPSLSELFPLSVARELVKLREIYISDCESLVVVISAGDDQAAGSEIGHSSGISEIESVDADIIMFPELNNIRLFALPKLESFYRGHSNIKYPSLKSIKVESCPSMKRWSYGENHIPNIKFEHEGRSWSDINDYITVQLEIDNGEWRMRDWCRDDKEDEIIEGAEAVVIVFVTSADNSENEKEEFEVCTEG